MNKWVIFVIISIIFILFISLYSILTKKKGTFSNIFSKLLPDKIWSNNLTSLEETKKFESKGEKICRDCIQNIFGVEFKNMRLSEIKNPNTNKNLEIDCFNKELKIGIEYHGQSHYKFIPFFHKTIEEFQKSQSRDYYKQEMCQKLGILLIIVPYNLEHDKICNYIHKQLEIYNKLDHINGWNLDR